MPRETPVHAGRIRKEGEGEGRQGGGGGRRGEGKRRQGGERWEGAAAWPERRGAVKGVLLVKSGDCDVNLWRVKCGVRCGESCRQECRCVVWCSVVQCGVVRCGVVLLPVVGSSCVALVEIRWGR